MRYAKPIFKPLKKKVAITEGMKCFPHFFSPEPFYPDHYYLNIFRHEIYSSVKSIHPHYL